MLEGEQRRETPWAKRAVQTASAMCLYVSGASKLSKLTMKFKSQGQARRGWNYETGFIDDAGCIQVVEVKKIAKIDSRCKARKGSCSDEFTDGDGDGQLSKPSKVPLRVEKLDEEVDAHR